ncbi:MAG: tetratricopeptide repeat protein [Thiofilum sp.]|uniref:YfgM family protein n=1 Tax=Thiofilum sp. TaxID=2212733 RepID=UPI0025FDD134|nr:tetratricopeptide repeat protein [Thiofilum sp.]MBK8454097.1 tetratricopeptide repeat protein [Thiofilum sp.]
MAILDELKTDQEKAEELKAWWRQHGTSVVAGVGLAIAVLFGYEYWQKYQNQTMEAASAIYHQIQQDKEGLVPEDLLKKLQADYSNTSYASLAALDYARSYAEVGDYDKAIQGLRWVVDHGSEDAYKQVARLRLARVLVAQNKTDEALKIIDESFPTSYQALIADIRGDIYVARNEIDKARAAYDQALLDNAGTANELIRLKRDNLGKAATPASPK